MHSTSVGTREEHLATSELFQPDARFFSVSLVPGPSGKVQTQIDESPAASEAHQLYLSFVEAFIKHRKALELRRLETFRRAFLDRWAIANSHLYNFQATLRSMIEEEGKMKVCGSGCLKRFFPDDAYRVQVELQRVKQQSQTVVPVYHGYLKHDADQYGVRLLVDFMADLMGRDTIHAKLFQASVGRVLGDNIPLRDVALSTRICTALLIVCANILIVFGSVMMLQDQSRDRLRYWIGTVAVMVAVDMLLVEPLEVLWFHYVLPCCTVDAVVAMKTTLLNILQQFYAEHNHEDGPNPLKISAVVNKLPLNTGSTQAQGASTFNMPDYQFVATNIAQVFPDHIASQVVLSYKTDQPCTIAHAQWPTYRTVAERLCFGFFDWSSGFGFESIGYVLISHSIMWVGAYCPVCLQQLLLAALLSLAGWLSSLIVYLTLDNLSAGLWAAAGIFVAFLGVYGLYCIPWRNIPTLGQGKLFFRWRKLQETFTAIRFDPAAFIADEEAVVSEAEEQREQERQEEEEKKKQQLLAQSLVEEEEEKEKEKEKNKDEGKADNDADALTFPDALGYHRPLHIRSMGSMVDGRRSSHFGLELQPSMRRSRPSMVVMDTSPFNAVEAPPMQVPFAVDPTTIAVLPSTAEHVHDSPDHSAATSEDVESPQGVPAVSDNAAVETGEDAQESPEEAVIMPGLLGSAEEVRTVVSTPPAVAKDDDDDEEEEHTDMAKSWRAQHSSPQPLSLSESHFWASRISVLRQPGQHGLPGVGGAAPTEWTGERIQHGPSVLPALGGRMGSQERLVEGRARASAASMMRVASAKLRPISSRSPSPSLLGPGQEERVFSRPATGYAGDADATDSSQPRAESVTSSSSASLSSLDSDDELPVRSPRPRPQSGLLVEDAVSVVSASSRSRSRSRSRSSSDASISSRSVSSSSSSGRSSGNRDTSHSDSASDQH